MKNITLKKEAKEWESIKQMEIAQDKYRQIIGEEEYTRMEKERAKLLQRKADKIIDYLKSAWDEYPNKNISHEAGELGYPIAD